MPCYSPITGYRSKLVNDSGKRSIVFSAAAGYADLQVKVACGQCIGCRLEYSRQWAMRCVHEASMHHENAFLTLTYAPEHLPKNGSISKVAVQKFVKRLRKRVGQPLRYFACGEYGEGNGRPHYHLLIFGYGFPDKVLAAKTKRGDSLFRSALLEDCWRFGYSYIGDVSFESAAYVARYVMKKRKGKEDFVDKNGKTNKEHYQLLDPVTGEVHQLDPEFVLMSRRPGIGRTWLEQYRSDTDKDYLTLRGQKMALPKYYDTVIERFDEIDFLERKQQRRVEAFERREDATDDRLRVREKVKAAQINQLSRNLEND